MNAVRVMHIEAHEEEVAAEVAGFYFERSERFDGRSASGVRAAVRLARASFWFAWIVSSYYLQRGLAWALSGSAWGRGVAERRWERVHRANARRLYVGATRLRGVYVKLGQVLSTLGTFLPDAYARELEGLQDRVPPRSFEEIDEAIFRAYGRPRHVVFARFSREPLAAASLGQVHRATTHDGRDVAVKVLYPDVQAILKVDLKVIGWALAVLRRFFPIAELDRLHTSLGAMLGRETDLRQEALALRRVARNFRGDGDVVLPEVDLELTNDRVLVMSFCEGARLTDGEALAAMGITAHDALRKLLDVFFRQVFEHRYFHADPHPGNFLVRRGPSGRPQIVLLDLGSASPTHEPVIRGLMQVMAGFFGKDDAAVMRGVETMGFLAQGGDKALVERHVKDALAKLLKVESVGGLDRRLIDELGEGVEASAGSRKAQRALMRSIAYPEGWYELERALTMLLGVCATHAPRLDATQVAFPHLARWMAAERMAR